MPIPQLAFDVGTAYDFLISLTVLHEPARFGLRGAWAAGVRSRLAPEARETLQLVNDAFFIPLSWVYTLPSPKDAATALAVLDALSPAARLDIFTRAPGVPEPWRVLSTRVRSSGRYTDDDLAELKKLYRAAGYRRRGKKELAAILQTWAEAEAFGAAYLSALQQYYDVFFAEEEARIRPALEAGYARSREMAARLPLTELLEELTEGLRFAEAPDMAELVIVPSFWTTPLLIMLELDAERALFVFGARPADASLVPGEVVPDQLHQALKALADPTRLRILRYLAAEPRTPAELARKLRLRAPTVIHHLDALRLARLVYLTLDHGEKRSYAMRPEAIAATYQALHAFIGLDE